MELGPNIKAQAVHADLVIRPSATGQEGQGGRLGFVGHRHSIASQAAAPVGGIQAVRWQASAPQDSIFRAVDSSVSGAKRFGEGSISS